MNIAALNVLGLIIGVIAAYLMYFNPPQIERYSSDGRRITEWVGPVTEHGESRAKWQSRWAKYAPWMLAVGFALQLPSAVMAWWGQ